MFKSQSLFTLFISILIITDILFAASAKEVMQTANEFYRNGDYENAIELYEELTYQGYEGVSLFFNLGNSYYRIGKIGYAILNYERALKFGNESLEQKSSVKFLGMLIDENLQWNFHFNNLNSKLGYAIYTLSKIRNQKLPLSCLKQLYYSLYHCHLIYGIILWGPLMLAKNYNKLVKSQKKVLRIMNNSKINTSSNPIFKKFGILKLDDVLNLELLKLMYLTVNKCIPKPISDIFPANTTVHNYSTRHRNDPIIIARNYAPLHKSFICLAPTKWSNLNQATKNAKSYKMFSTRVKKLLISNY